MVQTEVVDMIKALCLLLASSNDLTGATPIVLTADEKTFISGLIGHTLT